MSTITIPLGINEENQKNYFDMILEYFNSILLNGQRLEEYSIYYKINVRKCTDRLCNHEGLLKWIKNRNTILITLYGKKNNKNYKSSYIMSNCPLAIDFPSNIKIEFKKYDKNKDDEYISKKRYKENELQYSIKYEDSYYIKNTWKIDNKSNDWIYILFIKISSYLKLRKDFKRFFT